MCEREREREREKERERERIIDRKKTDRQQDGKDCQRKGLVGESELLLD